jgi:hypothetical protein
MTLLLTPLDDSIVPGQSGHIDDSENIAQALNKLDGVMDVTAGSLVFNKTAGGMALTFAVSDDQATGSGTTGLKFNRSTIGSLAVGMTLQTGGVDKWDVWTLDVFSDDLVLVGSHDNDGAGTFGDQLRFALAGNGSYGRTVGVPSALRRFAFESDDDDDVLMTTLLRLQNSSGSPVTSALEVTLGGTQVASISAGGLFKLGGPADTSAAGVAVFGTSVSDSKGYLELNNTGAGGHKYQFIPGQPGVTNGGFTLRNVTLSNADQIVITPAGNIRIGSAGSLAQNATDGFPRIPTIADTPSGTPTAYAGSSAGHFTINATTGAWNYHVGGQWWHIAGTPGAG